ncbi:MAG: SDR family NAD(P)-dependent oxidoreductase [Acidobacteriota bacterium]
MRVLVTGAAGFIGSNLSEALVRAGHQVLGVDNFDPYYPRAVKERNLRGAMSEKAFQFIELDLRDRAAVSALLEEPVDVVVHLAGRGGVRRSLEDPHAYQEMNYAATLNLLEGMRGNGRSRLVFASTSSVYGNRSSAPFREDDRTDWPLSPYAATKKACEVLCHTYHHVYGFHVYALRFFTVYGPRQRPDMAIHKFVKAILEGRPIERYGDGASERDYTYVDDITDGVARAVERVRGYEIINIGGSKTTSLADMISAIETQLGRKAQIIERPMPPGDVPLTSADVEKAGRLLGFSPAVRLEEGLRRFIKWYQEENSACE